MRRVLLAAAVAGAVLPYLGRWVPALDSLAVVQPYLGAALLIRALLPRIGGAGRAVVVLAAVAALWPALRLWPAPEVAGAPALRMLQHNVHYLNEGGLLPEALEGHDVATVQEVQSFWAALRDVPLPWVALDCPEAEGIGTAVLTRLPVLDRGCLRDGEAWARISTAAGPVTVLSLHLPWPWPTRGAEQHRRAARVAEQLRDLPRPVVVGGDFNQMPWSGAVGIVADAADAVVAPGLRPSYVKAGIGVHLPIDHILLPEGWRAEVAVGPAYGSDHQSLSARIVAPR